MPSPPLKCLRSPNGPFSLAVFSVSGAKENGPRIPKARADSSGFLKDLRSRHGAVAVFTRSRSAPNLHPDVRGVGACATCIRVGAEGRLSRRCLQTHGRAGFPRTNLSGE